MPESILSTKSAQVHSISLIVDTNEVNNSYFSQLNNHDLLIMFDHEIVMMNLAPNVGHSGASVAILGK